MAYAPRGSELIIRRPRRDECARVQALVQAVVDETYGGQWAPPPLQIGTEDWSQGWAAVAGDEIVGIILTDGDYIGDLWIASGQRSAGIGAMLLTHAEHEIRERGHSVVRLRCVATNTRALAFYARHDYGEVRRYPHEREPIEMIDLCKQLV
jgi:ribosomal protein S18 acetylase RimI-like enzyme